MTLKFLAMRNPFFFFLILLSGTLFYTPIQANGIPLACEIWDLVTETYECENDSFLVDIDFNYNDVGTDGFEILGNGNNYGTFDYADLPITLGPLPADCQTELEFVIRDVQNPNCSAATELGVMCCGECEIWDLVVETGDCTSDSTYQITVDFNYANVSGDHFDLFANGSFFGYYQYAQLPLTIPDFPKSGNAYDWLKVCDNDNPDCCTVEEFMTVECGGGNCELWDLGVEVYDCENDSFLIDIDFNYANVGNDGFTIQGNGIVYGTFEYGQLPITLALEADCETEYEFVIKDVQYPDCQIVYELGEVCCNECEIWDLIAEVYDCENDSFLLDIDFNYADVGNDGFKIQGNGIVYGIFEYADLPITLALEADCETEYEFVVMDVQHPNCMAVYELGEVCCDACEIWDLVIETGDCTSDSTYELTLDFNYANVSGDHFDLFANGTFFGFYAYSQLPLTIPNFPKSGNAYDWLKVCDNDNPDCCEVIEFMTVECGAGNCELWDLVVEVYDCENDSFLVDIDFNYANVGADGFTIQGNGLVYGTWDYGQLPITLALEADCETEYEFVIKDVQYPDCQLVYELGEVCCDACEIWDLVIETGDCTSDSTYELTLDFNYANVSGDHFDLFANGTFFGFYAYSQLPLTIPNFPKSGNAYDWLKVCDNDNPDCCEVIEFMTVECGAGNCELWDLVVEVYDCENDSFLVDIDFNYANVGADGFTIQGNGLVYGTWDYGQLPITLALEADCETEYEFVIKDVQYPDCQLVYELGEVCCDEECQIEELVVDIGGCTSDTTYSVTLDFTVQNPGNDLFEVWGNGIYLGYYPLADLPVTIDDFPASGNMADEIEVCINDQEDCCAATEFYAPNCAWQIQGVSNAFVVTDETGQGFKPGDRVGTEKGKLHWHWEPAIRQFNVSSPSTEWMRIQVYDVMGRLLQVCEGTGQVLTCDLSPYHGVLIIQVRRINGQETRRFVVPE